MRKQDSDRCLTRPAALSCDFPFPPPDPTGLVVPSLGMVAAKGRAVLPNAHFGVLKL